METRRRTRHIMSLTPLVDVVFLLLLFFALTLHFSPEEGIPVDLPVASTSQKTEKREAILTVNQENVYLNNVEVSAENLEDELRRCLFFSESIQIRADRQLALERLVTIIDSIRRAGFRHFDLMTQQVSQ